MTGDIIVNIVGELASVERYISPGWTLEQIKARIETITGVPPASQMLTVTDPHGHSRRSLESFGPSTTVAAMGITEKSQIDVSDTRPRDQRLDFNGEVEKYEMPLSDYEKRSDSVLEWKRQNRLGRFQETPLQTPMHEEIEEECSLTVGKDCWVKLANGTKKAQIAYVGSVEGIPAGTWVGLRLHEALGKNDGSVKGKRYFDAEANHGVFVRPSPVTEIDDNDDLEEL